MRTLFTLDPAETEAVSGGLPTIQPVRHAPLMAEDMYGDAMDVDRRMDYVADDGPRRGADPHDFPGGRVQ
jgi:hypothetical protein